MLLTFAVTMAVLRSGFDVPWQYDSSKPPERFDDGAANDRQAPANLPRPQAPAVGSPPIDRTIVSANQAELLPTPSDQLSARFGLCHSGGGTNCVVDGDTFWFRGEKIRIADIDTPETHPPRCAEEARLGAAATARLQDLLNAGPFSLDGGDSDHYGRALRTVTRGGTSLGSVLVEEGLARSYGSGRQPWC